MTDRPGVFAAGDATIGASTVIQCIAGGKLAARAIDAYVRGEDMAEVDKRILAEEEKPDLISIVPYKPVTAREPMTMLPYEERVHNFKPTSSAVTPRSRPRRRRPAACSASARRPAAATCSV